MSDKTIWTIQPQTRAKHAILKRYLEAWFPIIGRASKRVLYVDGFAGPGVYADGSPGSPIVALDTLLSHKHLPQDCEYLFLFNEKDPQRHASLVSTLGPYGKRLAKNVSVYTEQSEFTELVQGIVGTAGDKQLIPMFAFIDPFGYKDMPLGSLEVLLRWPKSEVLAYLDVRSLNRFADAGNVDDAFRALMGGSEFKDAPQAGDPNRIPYFTDLYKQRLRDRIGFKYTWSFLMRNQRTEPIYSLVFATRHIVGLERMKSAMWKVAPDASYTFSPFTSTETLFGDDFDRAILQHQVRKRFGGRTVEVGAIEHFVTVETDYRKEQVRSLVLGPLQEAGVITSNAQRHGTFPAGTFVTFESE